MGGLRILLVDDDSDHARCLSAELKPRFGTVVAVPDTYQALALHAEKPFDVVVLEVALPGASGIELLERLAPAVPAVVLTWLVSPTIIDRARAARAHAVLTKPCPTQDVVAAIEAAARSQGRAQLVTV